MTNFEATEAAVASLSLRTPSQEAWAHTPDCRGSFRLLPSDFEVLQKEEGAYDEERCGVALLVRNHIALGGGTVAILARVPSPVCQFVFPTHPPSWLQLAGGVACGGSVAEDDGLRGH